MAGGRHLLLLDDGADQRGEVDVDRLLAQRALVQPARLRQIVDQPLDALDLLADDPQVAVDAVAPLQVVGRAPGELREPLDRGERRLDLVRDQREEGVLLLVEAPLLADVAQHDHRPADLPVPLAHRRAAEADDALALAGRAQDELLVRQDPPGQHPAQQVDVRRQRAPVRAARRQGREVLAEALRGDGGGQAEEREPGLVGLDHHAPRVEEEDAVDHAADHRLQLPRPLRRRRRQALHLAARARLVGDVDRHEHQPAGPVLQAGQRHDDEVPEGRRAVGRGLEGELVHREGAAGPVDAVEQVAEPARAARGQRRAEGPPEQVGRRSVGEAGEARVGQRDDVLLAGGRGDADRHVLEDLRVEPPAALLQQPLGHVGQGYQQARDLAAGAPQRQAPPVPERQGFRLPECRR